MSFWKKWWKKKNKDKKDAEEYEDAPLPSETIFADNDLEKRIRARRNNLSVSRSGRYKAKSKERSQLSEGLYSKMPGEEDYSKGSVEGENGPSNEKNENSVVQSDANKKRETIH